MRHIVGWWARGFKTRRRFLCLAVLVMVVASFREADWAIKVVLVLRMQTAALVPLSMTAPLPSGCAEKVYWIALPELCNRVCANLVVSILNQNRSSPCVPARRLCQ